MIRVLIADDQMLVRQGIRTLLAMDREISVVGEAADGAEAIEQVLAAPIDVLLLDIRMPGEDGIAVLRKLSARNALPPTLILTTFDDSDVVLDGIRAGARGFLLKDVSYQQLLAAIRAVAGGATVFQPAVTERLLRAGTALHVDMEGPREQLTVREAEVVRLMAGGYSNREIAEALGTAEGTVKNHVSSILAKFGVRDRTRAVLKALETGVLRAPGPGREQSGGEQ
jgi:DNA-binding NarL/FixJ family response regulator